jgi:uncharacterized protein
MTHGFVRWTLKTTDVAAARSFYEALLEEGAPDVVELPASARAKGAPAHWLGYLAASEIERTIEAFVQRGATLLESGCLLRDPSGAVIALTSPQEGTRRDVVWQQLLTHDPERAARDYGELFGMKVGARVEVPEHGALDPFDWGNDVPSGSIGDITGKPHIHPQWLFFFRVSDIEAAMAHVRSRQGLVIGPTTLPDGRCVAVCNDPQGAQFALMSG